MTTDDEIVSNRTRWFRTYLIAPKMLHFVWNATNSFISPFFAIFYRYHGMDPIEIGILVSVPPFLSFVSSGVWTMLADKTGKHRRIMIITSLLSVLATIGIVFAFGSFYVLLLLAFAYAVVQGPTWPLLDTFVLSTLEDKELYGRQRLWGAIGWGLMTPLAGVIMDSGYPWMSFVACGFWGIVYCILVQMVVPTTLHSPSTALERQMGTAQVSFFRSVRHLLSDVALAIFLFNAFVMGLGTSIIFCYLFLFLTEYLDAPSLLLGISLTFTVSTEILFFWFAKPLFARVGVFGMVVAAHIAYVVRVLCYSFLTLPWLVLPIELLHGLTFAAMWAAGIHYVSERSPAGLEATGQGLFGGVFNGFGNGAGALLGGYLYKQFGPSVMFRVAAVIVGSNLLVFVVSQYVLRRCGAHVKHVMEVVEAKQSDGQASSVDAEMAIYVAQQDEDGDQYEADSTPELLTDSM